MPHGDDSVRRVEPQTLRVRCVRPGAAGDVRQTGRGVADRVQRGKQNVLGCRVLGRSSHRGCEVSWRRGHVGQVPPARRLDFRIRPALSAVSDRQAAPLRKDYWAKAASSRQDPRGSISRRETCAPTVDTGSHDVIVDVRAETLVDRVCRVLLGRTVTRRRCRRLRDGIDTFSRGVVMNRVAWIGGSPAHYTRAFHRRLSSLYADAICFTYVGPPRPYRTYETGVFPPDAEVLGGDLRPGAVSRLVRQLRDRGVDRLVVIGHSPRLVWIA